MSKVIDRPTIPDADLYEADFYAWTQAQAEKLRARSMNAIDWDNLAEEIESVGRSDKRELLNRLDTLLMHLLKWEFQPDRRTRSWLNTIDDQRKRIARVIEDSPSLAEFPQEVIGKAYAGARRSAVRETNLPLKTFPEACPYPIESVLSDDFMPGAPWSPDDLMRD